MKLKKLLCLAMAASMTFSLAACGSTDDKTSGTPKQEETDDKKDDVKETTLKVAALETAYGQEMWQGVCDAFEAANEGVTVELTMDKNLEDVIGPSMKSGEYPDVILCGTGREKALTETFVKDNNVEDMSEVLSMQIPGEDVTVEDKILPGFLDNSIVSPYADGKAYLMPMFYGPCGLFYNAGLLKEKGWTVPTTWDEMWALGDKAKAEGIALFTYPTTGYFDAFFYALLRETAGSDKFQEALKYGEGIWDTKEAKEAFDIVTKLASYTEKTTPANATDADFQKNQQLILDNKALFMPNGTWVVDEMAEAPRAKGFEWGFTALPAVKTGGEAASYTFFEQAWMPKGAENKDMGKRFMAYLYSDEAAGIFADKGGAVQPIAGMADTLKEDAKLFYSIYDNGAIAVMDAFATTDAVEGITIRGTFFDPVNSLVTGDKTEEDWIAKIKTDSDVLRAALK
ncbi:MAG: carbohydrate ABC transporter substrate-binding protein [Lachnospiraceae bacterium]